MVSGESTLGRGNSRAKALRQEGPRVFGEQQGDNCAAELF